MFSIEQINEQKEKIIEELKKTPIILVACQKIGISRSTYYRWIHDDCEFLKTTEDAIKIGIQIINDYAESKLITNIQKGDNTAIIYWLKNNHPKYKESFLNLNPVLQKQLVYLLNQNETELLRQILTFVISQQLSTKRANNLISSINKYFKAKTTERRQKEYKTLQDLITNAPLS